MPRTHHRLAHYPLAIVLGMATACSSNGPLTPKASTTTPTVSPNGAAKQSGTGVSATVTAAGHLQRMFLWTIGKSVTPTAMTLRDGHSGSADYTVRLTKTGSVDSVVVSGATCVTNTGSVATAGLTIVDQVQIKTGHRTFADLPGAEQTLTPAEQLAAGASSCSGYRIAFPPVAATAYRVVAHVTITNHSGWLPGGHHCPGSGACATGPEAKAGFAVPSTPDVVIDASVHVDDSDGQAWSFTATGSQTYTRSFACPADEGTQKNTATIRETGQTASAAVAVTCLLGYTFTTIDPPGAMSAGAFDINRSGVIVGQYRDIRNRQTVDHGFIYDGTTFTTVDYPGTVATYPGLYGGTGLTGVNDNGEMVGTHGPTSLGIPPGFIYIDGVATGLSPAACAYSTEAMGINDAGDIVGASELWSSGCYPGGTSVAYPALGYVDVGGVRTSLAPPNSNASEANGINDKDQIVGDYADANGHNHGFLYSSSSGGYTEIDVPGASWTAAQDINDSGEIVGRYIGSDAKTHGFVLVDDHFTNVDVPNATATQVMGVDDFGRIVGSYTDVNGRQHGFVGNP